MTRSRRVILVCLGALFVIFLFTSVAAQPPKRSPAQALQGMDVEFAGFDAQFRATYTVGLWLAPHEMPQGEGLIIVLRDSAVPPPYNPLPPEATWRYSGNAAVHSRVTKTLVSPFYYRGHLRVVVWTEQGHVPCARFGPIIRATFESTIRPYGPNTLDRNRLSLIVSRGLTSFVYPIDVWGAPPQTIGVVAASVNQTRLVYPWGTVLIGPPGIVPLAVLSADEAGHMQMMMHVPPELIGQVVYLQAMVDSFEDSETPWFFSQGVRIKLAL